MAKYVYIILMVSLFISCTSSPERNCTNFKTGSFSYKVFLNKDTLSGKFNRRDSLQLENYGDGKIDSSAINWVNDCEFVAKKLNPTSNIDKKPLLFKIISTNDNSYTFEYSYLGDLKNKHKGVAYKVN